MAREDEFKSRNVYNRIAKIYHAARIRKELFFNEFLEMPAMLSVLGKIRGKTILDVGCGTGIYAKILKRGGAKVCGIDISPKMIDIAKKEVKGVDFQVGSAYNLPYKAESFDVAISPLVLEHLSHPKKAFREVYRVLKRHGTFIFSIGNPVTAVTARIPGKPKYERKRIFLDYFNEGLQYRRWNRSKTALGKHTVKMPAWHFTYQTWIRMILSSGFAIEDYVDAKPIKAGKKANPDAYALTSFLPYFCIFKLRKP